MVKFAPIGILAAALACACLLPTYYAGLAVYAVVLALFGTAVNISVGYLGLISFGHAAFFGLGAYTAGLLTIKLGINFWLASLLAIVPGALLGVLVGVASLRLAGPYFAIATLATAEILRLVASNWISLTRGPLGIVVTRPRLYFLESWGLSFSQYHLIIALLCLAIVLVVLHRLLVSPIGRAWLALRDQEGLAESVGISALRYRVFAISLSGGVAALAGALLIPKILVLSPDLFNNTLSATGLLVAILGGRGVLIGPLIGGAIFAVVPEALRVVDDYRVVIFALLLLIIVRSKPEGLVDLLFPRRRSAPRVQNSGSSRSIVTPLSDGLAVREISRSFGGLKAVDGVSFSIRPREILGIIGPNGAGKTTCLSLISGFLRPSSGAVTVGGASLNGLSPHEVAGRGVIRTFQHATIFPMLTVFENIMTGTHLLKHENALAAILRTPSFRARECERASLAESCMKIAGLENRAGERADSLAYGEQRMLSVAIALAASPSVLLLDEPAAGLNQTEAAQLAELLFRLRENGLSVAIIDHNLRMMMKLCDRLVVLHHGQKLAEGEPEAVRNDPQVIAAYLGPKQQREEVRYAPA